MPSQDRIIVPLGGLVSEAESSGFELSKDTVNLYLDDEGYLVNYPGRTDMYRRDAPPSTDVVPATSTEGYTRLHIFKDGLGKEHLIFVKDNYLAVKINNGWRILYEFKGKQVDGQSYPTIFTHKTLLIVLNPGDQPLVWDGWREICPLGVTEIPPPPIVTSHYDPFVKSTFDANWNFGADGTWSNMFIWPPGEKPENGLQGDYGGVADKPGFYTFKVVYRDRYGNRSTPSPESPIIFVHANQDSGIGVAVGDVMNWLLVEWKPPHTDWHIEAIEIYRSQNLHKDLGNDPNEFFLDWSQENVCQLRYTPRFHDDVITANRVVDDAIINPPTSDYGCSFAGRVFVRDYYAQENLFWSDVTEFGQFRASNFYSAKDRIEALVPMGDRLLVVTHSTSEVLYSDNAGNIRLLEIHENKGSYFGRSFATFRNVAFGLFHDGFYIFDGESFKRMTSPYWLERDYVDRFGEVQKGLVRGDWYYLAARLEYSDDVNNVIMMNHLPTGRWFLIQESVLDMVLYNDTIIGSDNSIYFLFDGNTYAIPVLHIRGMIPEGLGYDKERILSDLAILAEPNSNCTVVIEITGDNEFEKQAGSGRLYPSTQTALQQAGSRYPFWNQANLTWEDNPQWVAPNDMWFKMLLDRKVTGFKHNLRFRFQASRPIRIKAIGFNLSSGDRVAKR